MSGEDISIGIEQVRDFVFEVDFGMEGVPNLLLDEPEPLGSSSGPNPSRVLAAAIGTCLSASLLFCLQKAHVETDGVKTRVQTSMSRNDNGRLRIGGMKVLIDIDSHDAEEHKLDRCADIFREYCVVTESVKSGIPVEVEVRKREG